MGLTVKNSLMTLLALKLKLRADEIASDATIEKLCGGNSARRNEILADIGAEFNVGAIDDAQNKPLAELATAIESRVKYAGPGAFLRTQTESAIKEKFPINRAKIIEHLSNNWEMDESMLFSVISHIPLMARFGDSNKGAKLSEIGFQSRLVSDKEAFSWLNKLVDHYATSSDVQISKKGKASLDGGAVDSQVLMQLEAKYFGRDGFFAKLAREFLAIAGVDLYEKALEEDLALIEDARRLSLYSRELGPQFERVAAPQFDEKKHVSFTSQWNWARCELIKLFYEGNGAPPEYFKRNASEILLKTAKYYEKSPLTPLFQRGEQIDPSNFSKGGTDESPNPPFAKGGQGGISEIVTAIQKGLKWKGRFSGKTALVTGAGPGSIASEIVKCFLKDGARVIVSTSSYSCERVKYFRKLYQASCSNGAELHLLPASQGSYQDIEALVKWTVARFGTPDFLIPFGAVKDIGYLTDSSPDSSSATLRVLLQGVEWLVGAAARAAKETGGKCLCVLPLSPNHGQIGGDGMYAETKLALEALLNKWSSEYETLGRHVDFIGCKIGWTRGTGLMESNDAIAFELERRAKVKTYSAEEMGKMIAEAVSDQRSAVSKAARIIDLTGRFDKVQNIGKLMAEIREDLVKKKQEARSKKQDETEKNIIRLNPNIFTFPELPSVERLKNIRVIARSESNEAISRTQLSAGDRHAAGAAARDDRIIVIVGFGEVSPFGNARSRYDVESNGELTINSAFELAWFMGLIKYESGDKYVGWVDAKTGEPVVEGELLDKYGKYILEHIGIRFVEPESAGFDPQNLTVYSDVLLEEDFIFPVDSKKSGDEYAGKNPSGAEVIKDGEKFFVRLKKGTTIKVPRGVKHTRYVSGQVPTGFNPEKFGISKELVSQVDRTSLFNFIASAEAFLSAGLTPQELIKNIHPSLIGNTQGSGIGGMVELDRLYHDHREDRQRKGDTLQETLINTIPAWLTQSYIGGYGPAVHPVGACATAVVSLSVACDIIAAGRAEFVVAGGFDDINAEGAIGFADMGATAPTEEMLAKGIEPKAMSRANDSRRGGFIEAQGGGTLLLTTLEKAVEMGLPVYAVLAYTATHSDGIHTSIPAPGLGLLSMVRGGGDSALAKALYKFGMTADDITVVSKHDTSTAANDPNENELHHLIQKSLGRSVGNPLIVHSQKSVLGHSKGGAGAWQANAAVQMLNYGVVPGNPNLDDVDKKMSQFDTMCFTDEPIKLKINGVIITSLGFGHVGAGALFIHPDYALAMLDDKEFEKYKVKRGEREKARVRREWLVRMGKAPYYEQNTKRRVDEAEFLLK